MEKMATLAYFFEANDTTIRDLEADRIKKYYNKTNTRSRECSLEG